MDWKENEIRNDLDKVRALLDALELKYGEDFGVVFAGGMVKDEDYWAGSCHVIGNERLVHQACHALLNCPKFIDEFFNAIKCVLTQNAGDRPEFLVKMMQASVDSMKRLLIEQTDAYKDLEAEHDADQAVQHLIDSVFKNSKGN